MDIFRHVSNTTIPQKEIFYCLKQRQQTISRMQELLLFNDNILLITFIDFDFPLLIKYEENPDGGWEKAKENERKRMKR